MSIRRTARVALAATVCTGVLAVGLTACGTVKELTAAQKVSDAFGKLQEGKTFKAELSLDVTADQLLAFDKAAGDKSDKKLDQKTAAAVAGLSLAVSVSSDKPLKELDALKSQGATGSDPLAAVKGFNLEYVLAGKDGKTYADIRTIDAKPYLKVDVDGIAALAGQDPAEIHAFADEAPAELKIVKDALGGKWVSLDPKLLTDLAKANPGAAAGAKPSAVPSIDPKTAQSIADAVKSVFSRNVTFEDKGSKDGLDHIVASAPARALADGLLGAVKPLAKDVPGLKDLPSAAPTDVPDRKIGIDLYLKDGALSSVAFDLAQIDDKLPKDAHLPVKLAFGKDVAPIQAPTGATEFGMSDITGLMGMFTKNIAGGLGGGASLPGLPGAKPGTKPGAGTAAPLTDAQLKELAQNGVTEAQLKLLNQSGLGYDQIKSLMTGAEG
ncbi:hypothetical protein [Kitasatospora sp. McL0602]|uniref:hypothetical protein n=1 Tax=Kitasatospora sp. McL0602 TaxID=3439530 RepID=UPI003F8B645C